jgi:preprotein translocase subunit SecA
LIEYKREAFDLFERLIAEVDYEIVHRIFRVAPAQQLPTPIPINLDQAVEVHPEIEVGVDQEAKEIQTGTVKIDRGPGLSVEPSEVASGETKITIERGGQVIAQEIYGGQGQLQKPHGKIGRNDPCWCGSGKKYKKCHYPN